MYCKICTKVNGLSKGSQGPKAEIFKILYSVDIAGIQEHQMANKYNTNSGDIFLMKLRWTKTEELICYWVYMLFFPKGTGHMHKDLGVVWLYYSQDSLQPFSSWITALRTLRPSVKSKRLSFLRVYSHDLKLQG